MTISALGARRLQPQSILKLDFVAVQAALDVGPLATAGGYFERGFGTTAQCAWLNGQFRGWEAAAAAA